VFLQVRKGSGMSSEVILTEDELPPEVIEAVREGRKLEAIKILREDTGLGLANAKVLVDRVARVHGPRKPIPSFADQPQRLSYLVKSLLMIFVVIAAYYFYTNG
jgi:hypothetical protein